MCRILFLTKCMYAEKEIEDQIRKLGHEVFCTASLLEAIQKETVPETFLQGFQIVLLSETISNRDSEALLPKIQSKFEVVIQMGNVALSEEARKVKTLSPQAPLAKVRETLSIIEKPKKNISFDSKDMLHNLHLSLRERRVLEELLNNNNQPLSQEELCQRVWGKEVLSTSVKCQISTLIRKLRDKIENAGYDSKRLKTEWGKGYLFQQN